MINVSNEEWNEWCLLWISASFVHFEMMKHETGDFELKSWLRIFKCFGTRLAMSLIIQGYVLSKNDIWDFWRCIFEIDWHAKVAPFQFSASQFQWIGELGIKWQGSSEDVS